MKISIYCLVTIITAFSLYANNNDNKYSSYLKPSVGFIENKGQIHYNDGAEAHDVLYKVSQVKGANVYITEKGITYIFYKPTGTSDTESTDCNYSQLELCRVDMNIINGNINKKNIIAEYANSDYINYYTPDNPNGITNIQTYQKITIQSVYPGIDWILYADEEKGLKYDFKVYPGADPKNIKMLYGGPVNIEKQEDGKHIILHTPVGKMTEGGLECYVNEKTNIVNSEYNVSDKLVSFIVDPYPKDTLFIDPPLELVWGTYFGS